MTKTTKPRKPKSATSDDLKSAAPAEAETTAATVPAPETAAPAAKTKKPAKKKAAKAKAKTKKPKTPKFQKLTFPLVKLPSVEEFVSKLLCSETIKRTGIVVTYRCGEGDDGLQPIDIDVTGVFRSSDPEHEDDYVIEAVALTSLFDGYYRGYYVTMTVTNDRERPCTFTYDGPSEDEKERFNDPA